jgi:hypothetical protein
MEKKTYSKYELDCKGPMDFSYEELKEIGGYWVYLQNEYPDNQNDDDIIWGGWRWIPTK